MRSMYLLQIHRGLLSIGLFNPHIIKSCNVLILLLTKILLKSAELIINTGISYHFLTSDKWMVSGSMLVVTLVSYIRL